MEFSGITYYKQLKNTEEKKEVTVANDIVDFIGLD